MANVVAKPKAFTYWAIVEDTRDGLRRIHGVYEVAAHAIQDAGTLQPQHLVEVVPFLIHRAPQWSSWREPALEETDDDFDVVIPDQAPTTSTGSEPTRA